MYYELFLYLVFVIKVINLCYNKDNNIANPGLLSLLDEGSFFNS
jgi:hypothetical protein